MNGISRINYRIVMVMFVIYAIASLQFLVNETGYIAKLFPMTYGQKLDYLDKLYYKNYFYRYYEWLNDLLPKDVTFSILRNEKTDHGLYQRYTHKLDYYFYPRYVRYDGVIQYVAKYYGRWPDKGSIIYTDAVLIIKTGDAGLKTANKIKYTFLNGRKYILVAQMDDKGLLLERLFIKDLKRPDRANIARAFKSLYGVDIEKAVF